MPKWNLKKFQEEILKMKPKTRSEVFRKIPYLYIWTRNNKKEQEINEFLSQVCMSSFQARSLAKTRYTKEVIFKEFKKYKTRQELFHSRKGQAIISAAMRFGIYSQAIKHFKKMSRATSIGEETVRSFLQKVFKEKFLKTRHPDIRNPKTNYSLELDGFCKKLNIAFEYGDHRRTRRGSVEDVQYRDKIKLKKCKTLNIKLIQIKIEFLSYKDYGAVLKKELLKEFKRLKIKIPKEMLSSKVNISHEQISFSKKEVWAEAKKHVNITSLKVKKPGIIKAARFLGILEDIYYYFNQKSYKVGKSFGFWREYKNIVKASKKCKTRTEFNHRYYSAYIAATKMGILDELCSHMKTKGHLPGYWTEDKVLSKAKEYDTLNDFRKNNPGAVTAADRLNVYHKIRSFFKNK